MLIDIDIRWVCYFLYLFVFVRANHRKTNDLTVKLFVRFIFLYILKK